jgi:hypothetical protein
LEARVRQCELKGIEASAEIQTAARRVADENKKLRGLLAQNGIGEDRVEAYLQSVSPNETTAEIPFGASSNAAQALESLLVARKTCRTCGDGNTANSDMNSAIGWAGSSSISDSIVASVWDGFEAGFPSMGNSGAMTTQNMISSETASSISSHGHGSRDHTPHHQKLMGRGSSSRFMAGGHMLEFDEQPTSYDSQQQQQMGVHDSPLYMQTSNNTLSNANSCVLATDMITTMAGGDPNAVRADLGCLPGMDCEVDNQLVFTVLDRYAGAGL